MSSNEFRRQAQRCREIAEAVTFAKSHWLSIAASWESLADKDERNELPMIGLVKDC